MGTADQEHSQDEQAVVARAAKADAGALPTSSPALASAIGNRAMARLARSVGATNGSGGREQSPEARILAGALGLTRTEHPSAAPLLARALAQAQRSPASTLNRAPAGPVGGTCACGGTILPGGECSKCMASRLARQGMPKTEIQRMVLARTALAEKQTLMRKRSFYGCLNANLASMGVPWAVIGILGGVCGILGGLAGLAGGPAAPATAPSGMALAAAGCIAFVTGLSIGVVLGVIGGCWSDTDYASPAASTASLDMPADTGDAATAMA
jgi:hypothetical protein